MKGKERGWTKFCQGRVASVQDEDCIRQTHTVFSVRVWSEVNRGPMGASDTKRLLFYVTLWSCPGVTPFTSWRAYREKPHITPGLHFCPYSISTASQPWRCEVSFKDGKSRAESQTFLLKKIINCMAMHEQTFTQTHTFYYDTLNYTYKLKKTYTKKKISNNYLSNEKAGAGWWSMLVYKHPVQGDCGTAEGDLIDTGSVIKRGSIWSHAWPGSLDFTHGFKSSKHDEMLDSLLISPARLAYTSNSRHTHTQWSQQTELYGDLLGVELNFTPRLIYLITVGLVWYFWTLWSHNAK